jgi:hypothetical protein
MEATGIPGSTASPNDVCTIASPAAYNGHQPPIVAAAVNASPVGDNDWTSNYCHGSSSFSELFELLKVNLQA